MSDLDDVTREFLVESNEGLDQLDSDLVTLEQRPSDRELLARIFRCIHTIKGTGGFLGFRKLEAVSHMGESLLALLRDGARALTHERIGALLDLVDAIRQILSAIEATGAEGDTDYSELTVRLTRLLRDDRTGPAVLGLASPRNMGQHLLDRGLVTPADVKAAADRQQAGDPRHIGEILVEQAHVPPQVIAAVLESQAAESGRSAHPVAESTIRVDVGLLDRLVKLVGELAIARDEILLRLPANEDSVLEVASQRLDVITTALQEEVMKTRMQPIRSLWSKFPRIVRDLATACKKQIRVEMVGEQTELDKAIIEAIKDPLTHIVRNSADHGIESPAIRVSRGKPAEGRIVLRAVHTGGQVSIEIRDDGGGIDPERLRVTAVRKGMLTQEQADRLSDHDAIQLVFAAGFSTVEEVTNVSGRGVGMDVVRTNIERIGGTVDITSVKGHGTTLTILIPSTVPNSSGLSVAPPRDRHAVPTSTRSSWRSARSPGGSR